MSKPLDLNDLRYFAAIIDAGSLSGASRALGVSKTLLSHHLSRLESMLGMSLIQRTTRRLEVTPLGHEFHQRCLSVLAEAERALSLVDEARSTPRGTLKISCPVLFAQAVLMPVVNSFLQAFPEVDLVLDADYRDVDLLGEGYDLALKIQRQLEDSRFIVRSFRLDQHWLVAAPELAHRLGEIRSPEALNGVASVHLRNQGENPASTVWQLFDPHAQNHSVRHHPRLASSDPLVLRLAVLEGIGVGLLPGSLCQRELQAGHLVRLQPDHHGGTMQLHAIYPSRHGLSRAARCFLEHLARHLPPQLREALENL